MFGIGITEMIVIGLVVLMLFSPRELPGMMKTLARAYGSIRRTAEEFRAQVMDAEELREPIEEIRAAYHGTKTELLSAQELARRELGRARAEAMKAQQKLSQLAREESRREASLNNRVSTSESPDAPAKAVGAPAGTVAVGSSAPVPASAPAGTVAVGSAPAGAVGSSAPAGATAPAGTVGSTAPFASSAPSVATANTVPSPPVMPTAAPPPVTSTPAPPVSTPSFAPPPAPSRAPDRSDAA